MQPWNDEDFEHPHLDDPRINDLGGEDEGSQQVNW